MLFFSILPFGSGRPEPKPRTGAADRQAVMTSAAVVAPSFIAVFLQLRNSLTQASKSCPVRCASLSWHLASFLSCEICPASRSAPKMSWIRSVDAFTCAPLIVAASVTRSVASSPSQAPPAANRLLTLSFFFCTFCFASAVRHASTVDCSLPLPWFFTQERFSLFCVEETLAAKLLALSAHFGSAICPRAMPQPSVKTRAFRTTEAWIDRWIMEPPSFFANADPPGTPAPRPPIRHRLQK